MKKVKCEIAKIDRALDIANELLRQGNLSLSQAQGLEKIIAELEKPKSSENQKKSNSDTFIKIVEVLAKLLIDFFDLNG
jgi:hypothetical protein